MLDVQEFLRQKGVPLEKVGDSFRINPCLFNGCKANDACTYSPSKNLIHCFSCGKSAKSGIQIHALMNGLTFDEAREQMTGRKVVNIPHAPTSVALANHRQLLTNKEVLEYFVKERKISERVLRDFKVGCYENQDKRTMLTFPYFKDGLVEQAKHRTINDKKSQFFNKGPKTNFEFLYNLNAIKGADRILIVEGEIDVLSSAQYALGMPTIGIGIGCASLKESWVKLLEQTKEILVGLDFDGPGREGNLRLAQLFGEKAKIVFWPRKDLNKCLQDGLSKDEIVSAIESSLSLGQYNIYEMIRAIPATAQLGSKIKPILELIAHRPAEETEDFITVIREKFGVPYAQVITFRTQIKDLRDAIREKTGEQPEAKEEIPEEVKQDAMKLLRAPDILPQIQQWLTEIGIVGEDENKLALWLFFLSRKMSSPIHAVVFGQSSSGKSELVKKVLSTVNNDDVIEFSSMSARSLDYLDHNLIGKVIFIAEHDGQEEVEATLRVAMSEGKLSRCYAARDELSGRIKSIKNVVEIRSVFIVTTTLSSIHNENNTRVFRMFVDERPSQTAKVIEHIKKSQNREYRRLEPMRKLKAETLKAVQRLLDETIEVDLPYGHLLEFPEATTRNRRDVSRFLSFIKVIAFLRQFQKQVHEDNLGKFIAADIEDYRMAYSHLLPILRNTLDELTPRELQVLEVCCLIEYEFSQRPGNVHYDGISIKDVQQRGRELSVDLKNHVNLRNELRELCEQEYLELVGGHWGVKGSRQRFRVNCQYDVDPKTNTVTQVKNLNTLLLSPDELAEKMKNERIN